MLVPAMQLCSYQHLILNHPNVSTIILKEDLKSYKLQKHFLGIMAYELLRYVDQMAS